MGLIPDTSTLKEKLAKLIEDTKFDVNDAISKYNDFIKKVNKEIGNLESTFDKVITNENNGIANAIIWEQSKIDSTIGNIVNISSNAQKTMNNQKEQMKSNFEKRRDKITESFSISVLAKLGIDKDDENDPKQNTGKTIDAIIQNVGKNISPPDIIFNIIPNFEHPRNIDDVEKMLSIRKKGKELPRKFELTILKILE